MKPKRVGLSGAQKGLGLEAALASCGQGKEKGIGPVGGPKSKFMAKKLATKCTFFFFVFLDFFKSNFLRTTNLET